MTPPGQPAVDGAVLAPELTETIRAARAQLERSILEGRLQDDPLRFPLRAMSTTLDALHRLFVDGTLTLAATLKQAQHPFPEEAVARIERVARESARGLTPKGEADLVRAVADRSAHEAARSVAAIGRSVRIGLYLTALGAAIAVAAAGFVAGRLTAGDRYTLLDAGFVAQLAELNDVPGLRDYCWRHKVATDVGMKCSLPDVWMRGPAASPDRKAAAR